MILGMSYAGDNSFSTTLSPNVQIPNVQIQNAIFKSIFITRKAPEIFDGHYDSTWTFDTILSSTLDGNLYGGNVNFTEDLVEEVRIKKKTKKDKKFQTIFEKKISTRDDLSIEFIDYCEPAGNVEYAYVAVISGVEDNYITTSVLSKFEAYFIVDGNTSYPCRFNTELSETHNYGAAAVKPLNRKYPITVVNGVTGYKSGTLEGVFMHVSCDGDTTLSPYEYREQVIEMLSNGAPKILKSYEGELYIIGVTDDIDESDRETVWDEQGYFDLVTTKFDWVECADAYDSRDLNINGFIDVTTY